MHYVKPAAREPQKSGHTGHCQGDQVVEVSVGGPGYGNRCCKELHYQWCMFQQYSLQAGELTG